MCCMYCINIVMSFTKNLSHQRPLIDLSFENRKGSSLTILIPRQPVFVIQAFMAPFRVVNPRKKVTVPSIQIASIICSSRNLISYLLFSLFYPFHDFDLYTINI